MDDEEAVRIEEARQWSSFVMDDALQGKEKMTEKLKQLEKDLDDGFDVNEESIRNYNFISYLYWRLGDRNNAFAALKVAEKLEQEPNLITYCNKVIFNTELEKHYRSKELLDEIQDTIKHKRTQSCAAAEIGYCFSRLGPRHHSRAEQLFQRAIDGIAPERNILWEYGLALTLRRQSNMFQMTKPEHFKPNEKKKEAACLLYKILKFPTDDYCRIKARAWCELGKILFKCNLFEVINKNKKETEQINERWCFQEAMKLCPNGHFVLERYGVYLRYSRDLEKSKEMLEMAIQLRDTIFSRHHLALTLKRMVEVSNPKQNCRRNLQHSFSLNEKCQSKHHSCDSGIYSLSNELASLSFGTEGNENKWKSHEDTQHTLNLNTTKYQRFKSMDSVTQRGTGWRKDNTAKPEGARYQNQSNDIGDKQNFISFKKSPRSVCVSPENSLLLQAVVHLQRALEMSQEFDGARYELGLLYRMLDKPDEALGCFSFITSNNCGKPSEYPMTLINAYEQQAICKLDLIFKESDPSKVEELRYDTRKCLWKALSVVSGVIGAIPLLKTTSQCFPLLKMLLQNEEKSSETYRELAKLHELLDYNEETITFYRHIIEIENDSTTVRELIQNYIKVGDFENAICTLSLLQCTKDEDEYSFYVDTYIKGAMDSLKKVDLEMAKIRFLKAYSHIFSRLNVSVTIEKEDENPPDILVLHNCGEGGCYYQKFVMSTLESFVQLKYVVNDIDCLPSRRRIDYLKKTMLESHCLCLILHENDNDDATCNKDEFLDLALEIASLKHRAKILQIRTDGVEQEIPGCKEIVMPSDVHDIASNDISQFLLRGKLFSKMLLQMSDMLREKKL